MTDDQTPTGASDPAEPRYDGPPWVGDEDLASLPKVSLHDHLDGSVRPATLAEVTAAQGGAERFPGLDPGVLERWLRGVDGTRPLGHEELFALLCSVMQTPDTLHRVAAEYVATAAADGVVYAEVRWAPEKHQLGGLSLDAAVAAVAAGLADGVAVAAADGHRIEVRQLLCAMRTSGRSTEIAELAVRSRDRDLGVVGLDLAGVEAGYPAGDHVAAFAVAAAAGLPATVHAGEGDGPRSMADSVELLGAVRIGHGTRIIEDISVGGRPLTPASAVTLLAAAEESDIELGPIAARFRDGGIPLEQCVSSNSRWVVPAFALHPVDQLRRLGFTLTVNPDNRMLSGTSVTREMARLRAVFGWGIEQFAAVTTTAIGAAFAPGEVKHRILREVIAPAYPDHEE